MGCSILEYARWFGKCVVEDVVTGVADSVVGSWVEAASQAAANTMAGVGTSWVHIPTPATVFND